MNVCRPFEIAGPVRVEPLENRIHGPEVAAGRPFPVRVVAAAEATEKVAIAAHQKRHAPKGDVHVLGV